MKNLNAIHSVCINKENYLRLVGNILIKSVPDIDYVETRDELELATFLLRSGSSFGSPVNVDSELTEKGDICIFAKGLSGKKVKMYCMNNLTSKFCFSLNSIFQEGENIDRFNTKELKLL